MRYQQNTLHDHINELRSRLFWAAIVFLIGGLIGYIAREPLIKLLRQPLHQSLYYTSPAGGFSFVMKICFITGLGLALPILVYNLTEFVRPAVGSKFRKRHTHSIAFFSLILAISGAVFAFLVIVPMSLHFFGKYSFSGVQPLLSADNYLNFVVNTVLTFVVIFQIPLIMLFIDRIRPLPPRKMLKYDKYVIVGSAALAVVLPFTYDPVSQFMLAIPIILLYNLSIVLIFLSHSKQHHSIKRQVQPQAVLQVQSDVADATQLPMSEPVPQAQPVVQRPKATAYKPRLIMDIAPRWTPPVRDMPEPDRA